ncbi:MAG: RuvB-like helicase [Thermofilaceae archaeon]
MSALIRFERVSAHSHIKGLGVREGNPLPVADGLVGQQEARRAAWIVVQMIKQGKMAGRAVLLAGPPGTGKTALAVAIARELGEDTPFVAISGSEIYSAELKKTEVLMRALRSAIGVRLREYRRVYEGLVKRLEVKFDRHPYNPWMQVPVEGTLTLKTTSEERTFTIDGSIVAEMLERGVSEGDVVWIDEETGRVYKVGRAAEAERKFDLSSARRAEIPRGPIVKEKEFVRTLTLHELDMMHSRGGTIFSLLFGGAEEREIPAEVRRGVDEAVKKWVDEGRAELLPGVLFIDDVHMLDIEAFSFLSRAMESELAPIIILASNRGFARIRGTDYESPHGIPLDLLDRLLIIETRAYTTDEIREILKIRAAEERVNLEDEALERLTQVGVERSLRYAVQLLTPAKVIAAQRGSDSVSVKDVEEAAKLFVSVKESSLHLKQYEELFLR